MKARPATADAKKKAWEKKAGAVSKQQYANVSDQLRHVETDWATLVEGNGRLEAVLDPPGEGLPFVSEKGLAYLQRRQKWGVKVYDRGATAFVEPCRARTAIKSRGSTLFENRTVACAV